MPLTARIIGMADLTMSVSDPCWKYLILEVSRMSDGRGQEGYKELKPRTRMTINDHSVQEHRRWSDPEPAVAVEKAIDH